MVKALLIVGLIVIAAIAYIGPVFLGSVMIEDNDFEHTLCISAITWGITESILLFTWISVLNGWIK